MFKSLIVVLCLVATSKAVADDVFLKTLPSGAISIKEASKLDSFYRCSKVKQGPNINPVKVKGSTNSLFKTVSGGLDNVGEALSNGETLFKCENVEINAENGRVRKI